MRRVIYLPILSLVVIILTYSASAQDQKSYSFGDKRDEVSESALPFTSFKFTPNVIDATTSSQTVTLDVQGLNTTYTSIQVVLVNQIWNLSNTLTFNEPSYSTSIAAYSANGTWIISSVTIDAEEMRETYSAETLVSNGFNISQIFVKSIFELNPPSIISVYTTINEVNTSVSSQFVTLYMYASDDDCGLRSSYSFSLSITDSFPNSYFGIFNQVSPGFYSATMEIECCTQSGELKIYAFSVSDNCGNSFLYQGNNVSITVNSNPDLVEPVMDYIKWIGSSYDITQAVPDEMGVIMNLSDDRSGCTTSITYNFSSSFFDGFRSFTPQLSNSNTNKLICNFTTTGSSFTNQIVSQLGMKWKGNGNFTLHEIKIQDRQRNIKTYTQQQLENDFNMITDFEIISLLDDTPPIVFSVDLPDVVLKTKRKSSSSFNLTVTSSDDLSGLSTVSINMENGRISQSVSGSSYNGFLGLSTKTLEFTLPGQYNSSIDSFAYVNDITITDVASNRVVFPIYRYVKLQDNAACYPDIAENNRVNFFSLSFPLSETELNFCGSTDEDNYDIKIEDNNSTDFTQFVSIMIKSSGRSLNIEALIFNKTNPTQSISSVPASTANYNFLQLKLLANETYTLKIKRTGSLADFPYSLILSECELTQFDCMEIGLLDLDSCECLNSTSTTGVEEITTGTTIITTGRMTTTSSNLNVQSSDEGITGGIIALIVVFGVIVPIITILVVVFLLIRRRRQKPGYNDLELKGLNSMKQVKDILLQERIGGGNFGVVWKGIMEGTIPVALKQRKSDAQLSSSDDNSVLHEATVLNMLNHKNIVLYYGVYIDIKKQKFMVTEFLPRGSLVSLLQKEGSQFDQKTLLALCYDVAMGLKYLKSRRVIHRDLAARNILVADSTIPFTKYVAKIADFGMSYKLDESSDSFQSDSNSVAAKWAAPEVLKSGTFSFASEVWSFGVIMWEIYSFGGVPLYGLSNQDVVDIHQRDEEIILDKPDSCPDHLYKILVHCMKKNITERITIEGVCDSLQTEMEKQPDFRHVSSIYQNVSTTKQQQFEIDETVYN